MLRLGKLTDYGITILMHCAFGADVFFTARELADRAALPLPTVSKLLKLLAQAGLVESKLGSLGGYKIARNPCHISLIDMVEAIEGCVALTDCSLPGKGGCEHSTSCIAKNPSQKINIVLRKALKDVTLADMLSAREEPV